MATHPFYHIEHPNLIVQATEKLRSKLEISASEFCSKYGINKSTYNSWLIQKRRPLAKSVNHIAVLDKNGYAIAYLLSLESFQSETIEFCFLAVVVGMIDGHTHASLGKTQFEAVSLAAKKIITHHSRSDCDFDVVFKPDLFKK